ncbi:helix-turn-helix transcriptional regulator [Virgibacillus necropolis]|uniref:helix-turn-helix transcriptional regulator n=1 Tax=Virgibacillus necropolis TaxID=163877 RepID=UPI00384C4008
MYRKHLFAIRKKYSITQKELAEIIGISEVYVRKIEKGVVKPGRDTMLKYEYFFNVDIKKLFPDIFLHINDKKVIKSVRRSINN